MSFGTTEASPGDQVSITTQASPGSVVVLGVIDKSLTLLADACKSVDTNNVSNSYRFIQDFWGEGGTLEGSGGMPSLEN